MTSDERGMTGIGVLILFIALVLVAAIASGLILDTAGLLQNKAQNTGEQATSEVSDRLSVLSTSGEVKTTDDIATAANGNVADGSTGDQTGVSYTPTENQTVLFVELSNYSFDTEEQVDIVLQNATAGTNLSTATISASEVSTGSEETYRVSFDQHIQSGDQYDVLIDTSGTMTHGGDVALQIDDGETNRVNQLSMTVYRSPGAGDVDLQQATVEYFSPDGTAFLIHEAEYNELSSSDLEDFSDNLGTFSTEAVKDDDNSVPVLNSRDDRASMIVPLYERPDGMTTGEPEAMDYLDPGASATIRITTQSGATTTQIVNVPESLAGHAGSTVML